MRVTTCVVFLSALLSACAPMYVAPPSKPTAELHLLADSDSTSALGALLSGVAFKTLTCDADEHGTSLGLDNSRPPQALKTAPRKILAEESFAFSAVYQQRRFGHERTCSAIAEFVPRANRRYEARLLVSDDVASCRVEVYDLTDGQRMPVAIAMPERVCGRKNGQGYLRLDPWLCPFCLSPIPIEPSK